MLIIPVSAQRQQGMSITATADKGSDTIIVIGQTVSDLVDVNFRVTSPSGNNVVAVGQISVDDDGSFDLELKIGQMWSEDGFYTITVMQSVVQNSLYTLSVEVEINNGLTEKTFVTNSNLETGIFVPTEPKDTRDRGLEMHVNYVKGSDTIKVRGLTDRVSQDITLTVTAPNGNIVSIDKISPSLDGKYTFDVPVGGVLWKQDGLYTITAQQFDYPKYTASTEVDFKGFNEHIPNYPTPQPCVVCTLEESRMMANEILEDLSVYVWTDKKYYAHNEIIMVTGQVANVASGFPVTITVVSPLNSIVTIDNQKVANDGSFVTTFSTTGNMWKYDGTYTIKANYGSAEISNSVKVELSRGVAHTPNYSTPPVQVQLTNNSIVVTTDKASYSEGDIIIITGKVRDIYSGTPVSVIVKAPNGNLVSITQVKVGADKKFSLEHTTESALMKSEGAYIVTAQYGTANRSAETTFEFGGAATTTTPPVQEPAHDNKITVIMHKSIYESGDRLYIKGKVSQFLQGEKLTWSIFSPSENKVAAGKTSVGVDKKFVIFEVTGGKKWKQSGQYIIEFSYGSVVSEKIINYIGATPHIPTPSNKISIPVGTSVPGCEDTNRCYSPFKVIVSTGATVMWSNDDSAVHTVSSGTPAELTDVFDSGLFMTGNSFEFTFDKSGTYDYFCMVHPWMTGSVVVTGESISIPDNNKLLNKIHKLESESSMLQLKMDKINLEIKNLYKLLEK